MNEPIDIDTGGGLDRVLMAALALANRMDRKPRERTPPRRGQLRWTLQSAVALGKQILNELEAARKEVERLQAKMSHRRCWNCGHVDYYVLNILPYSKCAKCRSRDTRLELKT